jgi:hypothetical protein
MEEVICSYGKVLLCAFLLCHYRWQVTVVLDSCEHALLSIAPKTRLLRCVYINVSRWPT